MRPPRRRVEGEVDAPWSRRHAPRSCGVVHRPWHCARHRPSPPSLEVSVACASSVTAAVARFAKALLCAARQGAIAPSRVPSHQLPPFEVEPRAHGDIEGLGGLRGLQGESSRPGRALQARSRESRHDPILWWSSLLFSRGLPFFFQHEEHNPREESRRNGGTLRPLPRSDEWRYPSSSTRAVSGLRRSCTRSLGIPRSSPTARRISTCVCSVVRRASTTCQPNSFAISS